MAKNKKVMSISITPQLHESLRLMAKQKGVSVSSYLDNLVEKVVEANLDDDLLSHNVAEEDGVCVLVKLPRHLKGDTAAMREWLVSQADTLTLLIAGAN